MAQNQLNCEKLKNSIENNSFLFMLNQISNNLNIFKYCFNYRNNLSIKKTSLNVINKKNVGATTTVIINNQNFIIKGLCANDRMLTESSNYHHHRYHDYFHQQCNKNNNRNLNFWKFMHLMLFLLFFIITVDNAEALKKEQSSSSSNNFYSHPANNEFSSHTIIQPKVHHGRHKRAITSTLEEDGVHAQHITLSFYHEGQKINADLHLNEQLIPQGHFLRYQHSKTGEQIVQNFTKTDVDLCHYQGTIRGNPDSRVAVSTCNGINGVVFDGSDTYFIYSGKNGRIHDDHYLFRHSDMIQNATCGYSSSENSIDDGSRSNGIHYKQENATLFDIPVIHSSSEESEFNRILRYKRSTSDNTIRGPYNANKHSSFVELVIVVDNKVYKTFGENMKKVHNHCKDIANIVNALYVPLNIFIALVGVVVWNESNEIELSSDGDVTLKNFLHYRRKVLAQDHPNDNAQLLTKEQFNGGVVGKALKGPMCTYEYSGGVSMEHSQIVGVVATTVAHEMGHNFGMEHDTSDCKCKEEKCIMSASSTSIVPRYWSSCSVDQLNLAFSRGMNYCLRNKPTKLFDSPQCGNGFVEPGEQCDCGLPKFCENTCCDPNTCMLYTNASCATGECCDLKTCRPKTAGTECRSADGECDLPEYCTGESEYCPGDVYKKDTESCDNGNAFCYQGSCRSRSNQCKILWGPSGESSEHCYRKNIDGTRHGNCGYDRLAQKYTPCDQEDVFCGMLHCRHLNERLEFGMESAAVLSHSFMNHEGSIIPCRTAIVDLGLQSIDPGLTPNGAKCGDGKMCVNQKCVLVEKLRAEGQGIECPENCNGQGICNSKGHCHCFVGFAPPYCNNPGAGGSEDSGPATNPNSRVGFTRAMYIFFLGVVPTVSLFLFFTYYWKQNRPLTSSTRKSATVLKANLKSLPSRGSSSSPPGGMPTSSPSSTDDMNSALLRSPTESDTSLLNNSMFGKFKGFTLRPLPTAAAGTTHIGAPNVAFVHPVTKSPEETNYPSFGVPSRSAPPPPKPPPSSLTITSSQGEITTDIKPSTVKQNGTLPNNNKSKMPPSPPPPIIPTHQHNSLANTAPALPPPNPGFNARPIISSPILEASTCTAKELISPLKTTPNNSLPIRPAPIAPPVPSHADPKFYQTNSTSSSSNGSGDKSFKDGTIKRIASFLKKDDSTSQRHPQKVKPVIDREKLKNIEISAPIPVVDFTSDSENLEDRQAMVARTQSMRDTTAAAKKPSIQSFGSMRQPSGAARPKSMVSTRPKSPPPRPPAPSAISNNKTPGTSGYQNPPEPKRVNGIQQQQQNEYDDCEAVEAPLTHISEENSPTGSDNIYSVIDERPSVQNVLDPPLKDATGSNDSMGLLGEIVNEIEKRNVDSIYSASTLKKKKTFDNGEVYANTLESNDYSEEDYLKSNTSTTSSGYMRPSSINTPVARVAPTRPDQASAATIKPSGTSNNNVGSDISNSFSSFKPKLSTQSTAKSSTTSGLRLEPKSSSKSTASSMVNRSTKPTTSLSKTSSDSVRKRSPSPVGTTGSGQKVTSNRSRPSVASTGMTSTSVRKNSIGDSKTTTSGSGNQSQKPKPFSKPPSIAAKPSIGSGSGIESKLNRQNSDTTKPPVPGAGTVFNKRSKSSADQIPTIASSTTVNRKASITTPLTNSNDNNSISSVNHNVGHSNINNISSNTTNSSNKILNAAARPAPGKISNVASLQQKFENATTAKSANSGNGTGSSSFSSTTNSMTVKK